MRICFSFASTEGEGYAGIIVSLPSNSENEGKVGEARFPTAHLYFSSPVELPIELKENFYYLAKAFPFPLFYFFHKDFSVFALLPLFKRSQISALCMELVNNFPYFPLFSTPTSICVFFFFFPSTPYTCKKSLWRMLRILGTPPVWATLMAMRYKGYLQLRCLCSTKLFEAFLNILFHPHATLWGCYHPCFAHEKLEAQMDGVIFSRSHSSLMAELTYETGPSTCRTRVVHGLYFEQLRWWWCADKLEISKTICIQVVESPSQHAQMF